MSEHAGGWLSRVPRALMATVFIAALPLAGQAAEKTPVNPGSGAPGKVPAAHREVNLRTLPNATAEEIAARPLVNLGPLTGSTPSEYAARKAIAAHRASGTAPRETPTTPGLRANVAALAEAGSLTLRASFAGNTESECTGALPPKTPFDQALAIGDGAAPILQVNNGCLSVWSQAGVRLIGPKTLQAFIGLPAAEAVFSPRAIYDWYNHRFILAFGDSDLKNSSYYDIAVSVSDDPTGSWHVYRFLTPTRGNAFNDFIRLGQDRQGVYVASNLFNLTGGVLGAYLMEEWLFLPKTLLYAGTLGNSYWHQSGMQVNNQYTDSTQPANVWSPYDNPRAEFLVGSFNINYGGGNCVNGCSGLYIWAVANPFGWIQGGPTPEVSVSCCAGTSAYYLPPNASQSGAPNSIETLDTRITGQVSYKSGMLYAALTTADSTSTPPWSDVLVYRLFPGLGNEDNRCTGQYQYLCPLITNLSTLDESRIDYSGNFAFYPAPQIDLEGNVFTVYNFSGSGPSCVFSCYPSLAYVSKRATSTPGAFADYGWVIAAGQALDKSFPWGRYSATAPTGVGYTDGGATAISGAGLAGAFVNAGGLWSTQIDAVAYTAPNQP